MTYFESLGCKTFSNGSLAKSGRALLAGGADFASESCWVVVTKFSL